MDLLRKYTAESRFYELDDEVIFILENFDLKMAALLTLQIERAVAQIKQKNKIYQTIGGVIKYEEPHFFALQFIYEERDNPYFFNIFKITSDEYLDLYNLNKIIK